MSVLPDRFIFKVRVTDNFLPSNEFPRVLFINLLFFSFFSGIPIGTSERITVSKQF